ncbi:MAG: hypothetical protein K2P17_05870 [Helicobacteraceae bacterium]|nr:hypothetical protein [Helicobacteraceae bacterium]
MKQDIMANENSDDVVAYQNSGIPATSNENLMYIENGEVKNKKFVDRTPEEQRETIKNKLAYYLKRTIENGTSPLFQKHSKESFQDEKNIALLKAT